MKKKKIGKRKSEEQVDSRWSKTERGALHREAAALVIAVNVGEDERLLAGAVRLVLVQGPDSEVGANL